MKINTAQNAMIDNWIMTLQGSGDPDLNKVVNDLVQLRRQLMTSSLSTHENRMLLGRIAQTSAVVQGGVNDNQAACLRQIQKSVRL